MGHEAVIGWIGIVLALLGWAYQLGASARELRHLRERQNEIIATTEKQQGEIMQTAKERYARLFDRLENMTVECPHCPAARLVRK